MSQEYARLSAFMRYQASAVVDAGWQNAYQNIANAMVKLAEAGGAEAQYVHWYDAGDWPMLPDGDYLRQGDIATVHIDDLPSCDCRFVQDHEIYGRSGTLQLSSIAIVFDALRRQPHSLCFILSPSDAQSPFLSKGLCAISVPLRTSAPVSPRMHIYLPNTPENANPGRSLRSRLFSRTGRHVGEDYVITTAALPRRTAAMADLGWTGFPFEVFGSHPFQLLRGASNHLVDLAEAYDSEEHRGHLVNADDIWMRRGK